MSTKRSCTINVYELSVKLAQVFPGRLPPEFGCIHASCVVERHVDTPEDLNVSTSNPLRGILSALFSAGADALKQHDTTSLGRVDESPVLPEDVFLGPTPWLDPNTNEPWDPPSLSD